MLIERHERKSRLTFEPCIDALQLRARYSDLLLQDPFRSLVKCIKHFALSVVVTWLALISIVAVQLPYGKAGGLRGNLPRILQKPASTTTTSPYTAFEMNATSLTPFPVGATPLQDSAPEIRDSADQKAKETFSRYNQLFIAPGSRDGVGLTPSQVRRDRVDPGIQVHR